MSEIVQNVHKIDFLQFLPDKSYNLYFNNTKNLTINGKNFKKSVLTKENEESGHIVYCDNGEINYILFTTGASNFVFHFETGVSLDESKEYSFAFSKDNNKTFLINSFDLNIIIEINKDYFFVHNDLYNDYYYYIAAGNCLSSNENKKYYNNRGKGACLFDAFAQIFFPIDYDNFENEKDINFNGYNDVKNTSLKLRKIVARIHTEALSYFHDDDERDNINKYFSIKSIISGSEGETYIRNIEYDSVWGEDYEIQILSKYFNLNCNLIQDNINYVEMRINILNKEIEKNNPDNLEELKKQLQNANKELENEKESGLKFFNQSKNDKYKKMYPFLDNDNNTYAYPYIFCNIGNNHWELKKHYCELDFEKELKKSQERFEDLKKGIYEDNKKKPSNDETQEIANIINAIDVFINSGSSSSTTNDYGDEVVSVVGAIDGSSSSGSSSGSSTSTTNDYSDEVVSVVGAIDGSRSTGSSGSSSSSSGSSSSSSGSSAETKISVPSTKTIMKEIFIKTSYIITKNNQKYLFAEIIDPVSAPAPAPAVTPTNKSIFENADITITEFWQNKTINIELEGYSIDDGAEKYFVVPIDDNTINNIK